MVPSRMGTHGSPGSVRICQISVKATSVPAIGVHRPGIRRIPHPTKNAEVIVVLIGGSLQSVELARIISAEPTTERMRIKPKPGQPPANVEYNRRKEHLLDITSFRRARRESKPQMESGSSLFRAFR